MATATTTPKRRTAKRTTSSTPTATATQARTTAAAARSTTRRASGTAAQASRTATAAERTLQSVVTDGAYATVGLGDAAVEVCRTLPERVKDAPVQIRSLSTSAPQRIRGAYRSALDLTGTALAAYATRGRKVLDAIEGQAATKRALDQTKVARSQIKGATTSVRKAVAQGTNALEAAASKLGARR